MTQYFSLLSAMSEAFYGTRESANLDEMCATLGALAGAFNIDEPCIAWFTHEGAEHNPAWWEYMRQVPHNASGTRVADTTLNGNIYVVRVFPVAGFGGRTETLVRFLTANESEGGTLGDAAITDFVLIEG